MAAATGAVTAPAAAATATVPQAAPYAAEHAATASTPSATSKKTRQKRKARQKRRARVAVAYAYRQIGDPYRWGGNGPRSWDCSGLVVGSYRRAGVRLPRTTYAMYRTVRPRVSWKGAVAGDLLFFYAGKSHMGIYVGHGHMIHAPSSGKRVRKVRLGGHYKRNFSGAVRPGY